MHQCIKCRRLTISIWISLRSVVKSSNWNQFFFLNWRSSTGEQVHVKYSAPACQVKLILVLAVCGPMCQILKAATASNTKSRRLKREFRGNSVPSHDEPPSERHLWWASLSRSSFQHGRRSNILLHHLGLYAFLMVKKCQWTVCLLFQSGWKMSEMSK